MPPQQGYPLVSSKAIMQGLVGLFVALLLATFYHRVPNYDDAWFAEQAYWLVHDGRVRSELFRGLNGWEDQLFVFHKLFVYFEGGWQWLVGFSLPASKSSGAIWTLAGGVVLYRYLWKQGLTGPAPWLGLLLYVGCGTVIEYSFVGRPEPMYATLGFGSFWLLTTKRWAWAAVLAGLATLTHLNSLCFVLAGLGWLGWQQQWKPLIGFGLIAGSVSSLYLIDVLLSNQWSTFWTQLTHDPALMHIRGASDKINVVLSVYRQFFINRTTATFTALVLGALLLNARFLLKDQDHPARLSGLYLLWLVVGFALITRTHTPNYMFTFVPFCCAFVVQCVAYAQRLGQQGWAKIGFSALLAVYLLAGVAKAVYSIQTNLATPVLADRNAQMAALIGQTGHTVLAPLDFFYDQIEQYTIRGIDRYLTGFFLQSKERSLTDEQLFRMAHREGFTAVITYDGKSPDTPPADTRPLADSLNHIGHYHRVYQDRWNSLYLPDR